MNIIRNCVLFSKVVFELLNDFEASRFSLSFEMEKNWSVALFVWFWPWHPFV
jgi:hypothetical protein